MPGPVGWPGPEGPRVSVAALRASKLEGRRWQLPCLLAQSAKLNLLKTEIRGEPRFRADPAATPGATSLQCTQPQEPTWPYTRLSSPFPPRQRVLQWDSLGLLSPGVFRGAFGGGSSGHTAGLASKEGWSTPAFPLAGDATVSESSRRSGSQWCG